MPPATPTASRAQAHARAHAKKLLKTGGFQQPLRQQRPDSIKPGNFNEQKRLRPGDAHPAWEQSGGVAFVGIESAARAGVAGACRRIHVSVVTASRSAHMSRLCRRGPRHEPRTQAHAVHCF
jgi:hypothetical protein